jgi:hypothetical protein
MTFDECVIECARNKDLVAEFDRLTGSNLSMKGTGLDVNIDIASGRYEMDVKKFVQFVKDTVWDRMVDDLVWP